MQDWIPRMAYSTKISIATLLAALLAGSAGAATQVDIQTLDARQLERDFAAKAGADVQAMPAPARHAGVLRMDPGSTLVVDRESIVAGGRHFRYDQQFRGLPVFASGLVVSQDAAGNIRAMFGNLVKGIAADVPSITARLSSEQAAALAKRATLGAREAQFLVEDLSSVKSIYVDDAGRAHLAFVVTFFAHVSGKGEPTEPTVMVDALDGRILSQWESLASAE